MKDDDGFDIYIDADHNKGASYDSHDRFFTVGWNDATLSEKNGNTTGVLHATAAMIGGFAAELAIPWSNLGVTPTANMTIGFDIANNEDDDGGTRDSQLCGTVRRPTGPIRPTSAMPCWPTNRSRLSNSLQIPGDVRSVFAHFCGA